MKARIPAPKPTLPASNRAAKARRDSGVSPANAGNPARVVRMARMGKRVRAPVSNRANKPMPPVRRVRVPNRDNPVKVVNVARAKASAVRDNVAAINPAAARDKVKVRARLRPRMLRATLRAIQTAAAAVVASGTPTTAVAPAVIGRVWMTPAPAGIMSMAGWRAEIGAAP